ncbi:hypothetical protein [Maribacter sp.]|uniref:hypothetical protein n=1 Tax=Maribacter sp. TaxID=1897614 RepID=UPI0025B7BDF5|nr:hypothetical protein [Maribacter sp.]
MRKLKDSPFYEKPLHILSYDFGDFYLYDNYIVGEIAEDVLISWEEQGEFLAEEFKSIYFEKYDELKYISNRIYKYSIIPSDWLKFAKCNYNFTGYGIVSYSKRGYFNALLEKVFVPVKLQTFTSLQEAIEWAKITEVDKATSIAKNEVA